MHPPRSHDRRSDSAGSWWWEGLNEAGAPGRIRHVRPAPLPGRIGDQSHGSPAWRRGARRHSIGAVTRSRSSHRRPSTAPPLNRAWAIRPHDRGISLKFCRATAAIRSQGIGRRTCGSPPPIAISRRALVPDAPRGRSRRSPPWPGTPEARAPLSALARVAPQPMLSRQWAAGPRDSPRGILARHLDIRRAPQERSASAGVMGSGIDKAMATAAAPDQRPEPASGPAQGVDGARRDTGFGPSRHGGLSLGRVAAALLQRLGRYQWSSRRYT